MIWCCLPGNRCLFTIWYLSNVIDFCSHQRCIVLVLCTVFSGYFCFLDVLSKQENNQLAFMLLTLFLTTHLFIVFLPNYHYHGLSLVKLQVPWIWSSKVCLHGYWSLWPATSWGTYKHWTCECWGSFYRGKVSYELGRDMCCLTAVLLLTKCFSIYRFLDVNNPCNGHISLVSSSFFPKPFVCYAIWFHACWLAFPTDVYWKGIKYENKRTQPSLIVYFYTAMWLGIISGSSSFVLHCCL